MAALGRQVEREGGVVGSGAGCALSLHRGAGHGGIQYSLCDSSLPVCFSEHMLHFYKKFIYLKH